MVPETQTRTALVTTIQGVDPVAKVHRRRRIPKDNQIGEWARLNVDAEKKVNSYHIRRLRRIPEMRGIPKRLVKVTHLYEIRFYFGLKDLDDDSTASEEIAQQRIEDLAAAFEASPTLGLGASVSHSGLGLPNDFEDVQVGSYLSHRALMQIAVEIMNVSCP
jgi:hypothetical protein